MDKEQLYRDIRVYTSDVGEFTVADVMKKFGLDYAAARATVKKLETDKLVVLKNGVTFEYSGPDRKVSADVDAIVDRMLEKGEQLDSHFCDALLFCAQAQLTSLLAIQTKFSMDFSGAVRLGLVLGEFGLGVPVPKTSFAAKIRYADAVEIVEKYRKLYVPPEIQRPPLENWESEQERNENMHKRLGSLCDWFMTGEVGFLKLRVLDVLTIARKCDDKRYAELCLAMSAYLEEQSRSEEGKERVRAVMRERNKAIRRKLMGEGLFEDFEIRHKKVKQWLYNYIKANKECSDADLFLKLREVRLEAKYDPSEAGAIKRCAVDWVASPFEMYIIHADIELLDIFG